MRGSDYGQEDGMRASTIREVEKDLGSTPTTQLLWIWRKSPVSYMLLGLFLDKSIECLGLSRDKDKPQSSCLFRCCPRGNRG